MTVTATVLKQNFGKYLMMSKTEDIYITKNGKVVAKLTNPNRERVDMVKALFGIISKEMDFEETRKERLSRI